MSVLDDFDINPINALIAAVAFVALLVILTRFGLVVNGTNARKDQLIRVERLKVCGTIQDEAIRALCVIAPQPKVFGE